MDFVLFRLRPLLLDFHLHVRLSKVLSALLLELFQHDRRNSDTRLFQKSCELRKIYGSTAVFVEFYEYIQHFLLGEGIVELEQELEKLCFGEVCLVTVFFAIKKLKQIYSSGVDFPSKIVNYVTCLLL